MCKRLSVNSKEQYLRWAILVVVFVSECSVSGKYAIVVDGLESENDANSFADFQKNKIPSFWKDKQERHKAAYKVCDVRVMQPSGIIFENIANDIRGIFLEHVSHIYI